MHLTSSGLFMRAIGIPSVEQARGAPRTFYRPVSTRSSSPDQPSQRIKSRRQLIRHFTLPCILIALADMTSVVPTALTSVADSIPGAGSDLPSLSRQDAVKVKVLVNTPTSAAPGQDLKLSDETTFTLGTNAIATNLSTVFTFLNDDFRMDMRVGSYQRLL